MPAAPAAIPLKPKSAATRAIIKKTTINRNIEFNFKVNI